VFENEIYNCFREVLMDSVGLPASTDTDVN